MNRNGCSMWPTRGILLIPLSLSARPFGIYPGSEGLIRIHTAFFLDLSGTDTRHRPSSKWRTL